MLVDVANEGLKQIEVRRQSPRFQLIRREIERLGPDGMYRFVGDCDSPLPMVWQATRSNLERTFARAMSTPSYQKLGLFHQLNWDLADQYLVSEESH